MGAPDRRVLAKQLAVAWKIGKHMVMPRREVLAQLDDDLVEHLDQIAKALDTNRLELLCRGAQAVIDADNDTHSTSSTNLPLNTG
jgi:predicted component of type VI protein secretion system